MSMADNDEGMVARILERLGWYQPDTDVEAEARLRDQERRLRALEVKVAVRERADRAVIAEVDRLAAEDEQS
jgi:ribosomal protein S16